MGRVIKFPTERRPATIEEWAQRLAGQGYKAVGVAENLKILYVNETLASILGYNPKSMVGKHLLDYVASHHHNLYKEPSVAYEYMRQVDAIKSDGSIVKVDIIGRTLCREKNITMSLIRRTRVVSNDAYNSAPATARVPRRAEVMAED
jgi:PAS domain S-box-containing protein